MALPVYNTGLAQVTQGSRYVNLSGGASLTVVDATSGTTVNITGAGDLFFYGAMGMGVVKRVVSATQLELFLPWSGPVVAQSAYTIVRQSIPLVGSAAALAQSIQNMGNDDNPFASLAVDNGVARIKERISASGKPQLAVGATDAADSALLPALEIDPVTGVVSFPSGSSSVGGGGGAANNCSLQNRLLNGAFEIWQSGTTFGVGNNDTITLTADRWIADNHAGVLATFAKSTSPAGFRSRSAVKITANTVLASGYIGETQVIGSDAAADLDGQSVTLSFDVNATTSAGSLTGKVSIFANTAPDNNTFATSILDSTFVIPAGSGKVSVTVPAANTVGLANGARIFVGVTQNTSTSNIIVYLSSIQFEKGVVADDFDYRPNALEYWLLSAPPGAIPSITFDPLTQQPIFQNLGPTPAVIGNGDVTLLKPANNRLQWQIKDSGGVVRKIDVSNQVNRNEQTANYVLSATDANAVMVVMNSATPLTVTIPAGVFPVGTVIPILVKGPGQVTIVAGSGVTLHTASSLASRTRYAMLSLYQDTADEWMLSGDLA